jgi:TorA maturation chaperone TorD
MSAAAAPREFEELTPEDAARADLYALLAHLFHAAPDADLLAVLANADDVSAEAPHSAVGEAWRKLQSAASAADPEALAQEFQDLFVGVGGGEVMAYGSWHLTGFLMEEPLARLRDDLAQLGLSRLQSAAEPEDHIAALAEVMRLLVRGGGDGIAAAAFEVQKAFFTRHLRPWYARFAEQLAKAPSANFYRAVGELAETFLDTEAELFETY